MKKTPHHNQGYFPNKRLLMVYTWKVIIPLLLPLFIYFTYALILKVDHPLLRVAARGELLILSAIILVEAALELRAINSRYDKLLVGCAILVLLLFGTVNHTAHLYQSNLSTTAEISNVPRLLLAFSFFNSAVTFCSIACSIYVFSIVSRELTIRRLTRMVL